MRPQLRRPARSRVGSCRGRVLWATILLLALGHAVHADEPRDESERWAPAFALYFDMLGQKAEGTAAAGGVLGPPLDPFDAEQDAFAPGTGCLRRTGVPPGPFTFRRDGVLCATGRTNPTQILPDSDGDDTSVVPLVGASLELMTPRLLGETFLRPRLFAHADVSAAFAYERNLAGVEGPDDFAVPQGIVVSGNPEQVNLEELSVLGQGSRTRMQVERWLYSGGVGVALSVDAFNRRLRFKPSFEYQRMEIEFSGVVHRAVKLRTPTGATDLSAFRQISLTDIEKKSYDGIGPGLEIEADAARLGPFISSVYVMGRGYYLLGSLDVSLSASNEFGETASWTADLDRWAWRAGVGFRVRWSPETD